MPFLNADAATLVEGVFSRDQVRVVLDEPFNSQGVSVVDLLVGLQHQDDVAVGGEAFLLVADEVRNERRCHEFVVARAATIEIAVLLGQLEGIERPVGSKGLDDIKMRHEQDRFAGASAAQPCHQVALARGWFEHLNVVDARPT